jgi:dihydroorotate dehydrogenase electron transfer subunit
MNRPHRNTIFLEDARVLQHRSYPGSQYVLRLEAPQCANRATPGSFIHLQCGPDLPMRRPLSILRANAAEGWIEVLYKILGQGLRVLAEASPDDRLSVLGPIGQGFRPDPLRRHAVLIGGGVGIPPLVFLAERLAAERDGPCQPVAFFGSEIPFPFKAGRSTAPLGGIDRQVNACMPELEALGVPSRLASLANLANLAGFDGCYRGYVTALARQWLAQLDGANISRVMIFGCGPDPMLRAAAALAAEFGVPTQVCLEEFMACGVGGCAGCTVAVATERGPAMKRVCVDGPVFDARSVYPEIFAAT